MGWVLDTGGGRRIDFYIEGASDNLAKERGRREEKLKD